MNLGHGINHPRTMLRRAHEHAVEIVRVVRVGDEIELLVKIGVRSPETARTKAEMSLRTRRDL
jgi:hypothetical protein